MDGPLFDCKPNHFIINQRKWLSHGNITKEHHLFNNKSFEMQEVNLSSNQLQLGQFDLNYEFDKTK